MTSINRLANVVCREAPEVIGFGAAGAAVAWMCGLSPVTGAVYMVAYTLFNKVIEPLCKSMGTKGLRGAFSFTVEIASCVVLAKIAAEILGCSLSFSNGAIIALSITAAVILLKNAGLLDENLRWQFSR